MNQLDTELLQTAASLENLAVRSYALAGRLAAVSESSPVLLSFARQTMAQHAGHAKLFNARAVKAGGRPQPAPDPRYAAAVRDALTGQANAAGVLSLLESLEDTKAQTYTRYASLCGADLRSLFVSVAAVEAQHRAFLLAALRLFESGELALAGHPAELGRLPGAVGAGCLPVAFYPTAGASAVDEGAVR
jgi:hypothetical protein